MRPVSLIALALSLAPALAASSPALASGFYYSDLGAKPLGRGATGAAGAGDLSAMAQNPAGLLELDGLRVQLELSLTGQPVSFRRAGSCGGGSSACPSVENSSGAFLNTLSGASLRFGDFVAALGVYGPPSVGRYQYADPRAPQVDVASYAPQRYSLIESDNFILYPGVALAWRATRWLDVGAVVQVRTFHVHQAQSIYVLGDVGGDLPEADAIATFDARDRARLAFGAGLIARPLPGLSIGLSARPAVPVHAEGTLEVNAPLASIAGIRVEGHAAQVELTLPAEAMLGVRYERGAFLGEFDLGWEGWGTLREIVVTPLDVVLKQGTGDNEVDTKIAPIHLLKHYHGAFSFRLGGEWELPARWLPENLALRLRAGALYEQSAIPDDTLQVDFPNLDRAAATLGATARYRALSLTLGYAHFFSSSRTVTNSAVARINPLGTVPFLIGNGTYQSSLDALAGQLAYSFDL
jgi:long-subunit fatty acid transport protein